MVKSKRSVPCNAHDAQMRRGTLVTRRDKRERAHAHEREEGGDSVRRVEGRRGLCVAAATRLCVCAPKRTTHDAANEPRQVVEDKGRGMPLHQHAATVERVATHGHQEHDGRQAFARLALELNKTNRCKHTWPDTVNARGCAFRAAGLRGPGRRAREQGQGSAQTRHNTARGRGEGRVCDGVRVGWTDVLDDLRDPGGEVQHAGHAANNVADHPVARLQFPTTAVPQRRR